MARIPRPNFGKNRPFWLGILGSLLIIGLLVGSSLYKVAGFGEQSIEVEFEQAAGMRTGQKVRVAGIQVGTVKSLKLDGDHVTATLSIDNDLKLGPDAKAQIKLATILGTQFVNLDPGNGLGLPDDRIYCDRPKPNEACTNTEVPFSFAKVVNDPTKENQFDRVEEINTKQLADSLDLLNKQFGDSPQLIAQSLDSVGVLAKVISTRRNQFDALLHNLDAVSNVLGDNQNSVLVVITQGQAIAERIMERQDLITRLLNNVGTLSKQLQDLGSENNGQLGPMIQQLNTMSEGLKKNSDQLDSLLQLFPVVVRQMDNVFGNGPYADINLSGGPFPDNWLCFVQVIIDGCR
ncbi:MlaD family protein [Antrihabitans stalactiti]|jgi:phospholipid/cholesterol/gamma-HCH transport system substrate-binding protein|uniref:MCE family protein n=1 Tax=Antrihabitans stalactiti TaxID=2584121 RepID=A0A848KF95_9NOCA|nr:MlaD family protein [Antrihabitans stalactiti]NMN95382.1 MCE family protein [Antrihabitans stalactiti]